MCYTKYNYQLVHQVYKVIKFIKYYMWDCLLYKLYNFITF